MILPSIAYTFCLCTVNKTENVRIVISARRNIRKVSVFMSDFNQNWNQSTSLSIFTEIRSAVKLRKFRSLNV